MKHEEVKVETEQPEPVQVEVKKRKKSKGFFRKRKTKESKPLTEGEDDRDEKVDIEMVQDQPPATLFKVRGRKTAVKDKSMKKGLTFETKDAIPEKRMKEMFKLFDKNKDGVISRSEVKTVLRSMGQETADLDVEIDGMLAQVDEDNDGEINFREFKKLIGQINMEEVAKDKVQDQFVQDMFDEFDISSDGLLSIPDLMVQFHKLGDYEIRKKHIKEMMYDVTGTDTRYQITLAEFKRAIQD